MGVMGIDEKMGSNSALHEDVSNTKQQFHKGTLPTILASKTPEEMVAIKKSLVRKIDTRLLPMLIILFLLK
jgi:hypothetical protein